MGTRTDRPAGNKEAEKDRRRVYMLQTEDGGFNRTRHSPPAVTGPYSSTSGGIPYLQYA